jgi:DNA polymerase (family 10)
MTRANEDIAALLREYSDLLLITGGDAFRARIYERAARAVAGQSADVGQLDAAALRQIPGVGKSIAEKIAEYRETGTIRAVAELRADIPAGVRELTRIPALGPKRAMQLYRDLQISSVDELTAAIKDGRLRDLKGFGPKSEDRIRHGIEIMEQAALRVPLNVAMDTATAMVGAIGSVPGCVRCAYAGSLRRMRETIGDVDILAAANQASDAPALMAAFTALPGVDHVIASGDRKTSVRTRRGLQVDLRVVPLNAWGAALQYFTGSQAHNVRTREIAVRMKLKLSEYGLFDVASGELIVSRTEEEVYRRLGMAWMPPELREDAGEIQAAIRGKLPDLVMQRMTSEKMLAQREQVRALGGRLAAGGTPMTLLHGTELNIAPDGTVDWPAEFLAGFDLCVASVHSHFGQSRAEMTRRFVAACENPHVNIIGHPTARKIGKRPPVDVDVDELFRACQDRHGPGGERPSRPARPARRSHPRGQGRRGQVRHRQRRALHRAPRLPALRRGHRAPRLAHGRGRDQHLAAGPAAGVPPQGPVTAATAGTLSWGTAAPGPPGHRAAGITCNQRLHVLD